MNNATRRALILSIILHAFLFVIIFFFYLPNVNSQKKIVQRTFQLQSIPKDFEKKKLVSKIENKNTKENKKEQNKENTIQKPSITKNTISYDDFIKTQKPNNKKVTKKEVKFVSKPIEAPKIKTHDNIESNLQKKLLSLSSISAEELLEYESYLYAIIDSAWECPKSFDGYKNSALFVFEVDISGRIMKVKVMKSSGSEIFDESVTQAFKRITTVKPNPTGKRTEFQLTFSKKKL